MFWTKENMKKANEIFTTKLPVSSDKLVVQAYYMVFDTYDNIKNMAIRNDWKIEDIMGNKNIQMINGKIVFFNECNYDHTTNLPIGDFDNGELSIIRNLQIKQGYMTA